MNNDINKVLYDSSEINTLPNLSNTSIDNDSILECKNLFKTFANTDALKGINLKIKRGRIVGLLGPNGSGKSTLIKLANGLLTPSSGEILIGGNKPGIETKKIVSYLPERTYLNDWMRVSDIINFFQDFYDNFNSEKAYNMLQKLNINTDDKLKTMSKGTKEKVQLILVMSREADLYLLDEPIAGVDPAARDYILNTIISNYNENATIIISTHLISDIERILDDVVFISYGNIFLTKSVDEIRETEGKSVDALFREVFRC
jgi:ABC-2 type transport system ATP-binding protein